MERVKLVSWNQDRLEALVALWNAEICCDFPMRESLFLQNSFQDQNLFYDGSCIAIDQHNHVIGFIIAKKWQEQIDIEMNREAGWIQAISVASTHRRQGIGSALLSRAEAAFQESAMKKVFIGRDPYHYFPGIPCEYEYVKEWFSRKGYVNNGKDYDVICSYDSHEQSVLPMKDGVEFTLLKEEEQEKLISFLHRCFPGRWEYEAMEYFKRGGTGREFIVLKKKDDIIGFCRINDEKSPLIAQNVYWAPLFDEPLGGIGPLGVDGAERKKGYGLAIVEAGIHFLRERGITKIVIDWTGLIDFYKKLGYLPWKTYCKYSKDLLIPQESV